jgi:epoxyqueuosine reductase
MPLTDWIKREALGLGFDVVGISRIDRSFPRFALSAQPAQPPAYPSTPLSRLLSSRLTEWLRRGLHGTMTWMECDPARRADPGSILPGCRSVISVGMNYYTNYQADERPGFGRIARYAWGRDYHTVLGERLETLTARIKVLAPAARTLWYVDTGPVMEKAWAQQAGLGWIGKHSNLVSERYGSWLLLGEILTTLELNADEPGADLCGSCTLCIRACPTGAITEPYVVDARRCISYLTIELHHPGDEIPEDLAPKLGNRIFGCDDCLDVCPYNLQASATSESAFQPSPLTLAPRLSDLAESSEAEFATWLRQSPIRRAKHSGFLRNVRTALRNLGLPACSSSGT